MPRFVLLRHECPPDYEKPSHWDLMLQQGDSLATWELRELPASWTRLLELQQVSVQQAATVKSVTAIRLPDHRLAYLDFAGPLSRDRGEVCRCDSGAYKILKQQENCLVFYLSGTILTGKVKLSRGANIWQLDTQ